MITDVGVKNMAKFKCRACEYVYDEEKGDPENKIKAGTKWDDVSDEFVCPLCGVGKEMFDEVRE